MAHGTLFAGMPNATFKDSAVLVNGYRAIKSDQELVYTRRAARFVEAVHQCIAEVYDASLLGVDGHGGDYTPIIPLLLSGADVSAPHLTWDDKPMKRSEATFFEIASAHRHYHCPMSRSVFLGKPTDTTWTSEKRCWKARTWGSRWQGPAIAAAISPRYFSGSWRNMGSKKPTVRDTPLDYPIARIGASGPCHSGLET